MAKKTPVPMGEGAGSEGIQTQWLTLKEASEFLGIHFTTLRTWADNGDIQVFRTPGGHRRFSSADLRRFLENRVDRRGSNSGQTAVVETAIQQVHNELKRLAPDKMAWHYQLNDEATVARRNRGQQLFALALSFVMKPAQQERILEEGRRLGFEYGYEAHSNKVNLVESGRAVRFFRNQLIQAVRATESPDLVDADDLRIQQQIDLFLDEVLYAVLEGYDQMGSQ
ncbi:MAG: helix-turn-helix domain-containing protein [Caldilineaceae bacterium]|nr:helix-turn-helix domain-containing protein [Caldilineaceae bacterium]